MYGILHCGPGEESRVSSTEEEGLVSHGSGMEVIGTITGGGINIYRACKNVECKCVAIMEK